MKEACERCGKIVNGPRLQPICDRCEIAEIWPWGYLKLLALVVGAGLTAVLARHALHAA
jgi:hypothetical protein